MEMDFGGQVADAEAEGVVGQAQMRSAVDGLDEMEAMPPPSDGYCASLGIRTNKVTGRDRTAARTGKTSAAGVVQISHPQNASAS